MLEGKVSVVIPIYNGALVVEEALRSVLALPIVSEVVCVNDGSTDNTSEVIESVKDARIRLLNVENGGPARARNIGALSAVGEYIAFLDADDFFMPRRFDKQLSSMISGGYRASICSVIVATMDNVILKVFDKGKYSRMPAPLKRLAIYCQFLIMNTPTLIVRRDLFEEIGGFDVGLKLREDHKLLINILETEDIYIEARSPVVRRMFDQSSTSNLSIEKLIDGNSRFLSAVTPNYWERLGANLSLFHVCLRRYGFLRSMNAKKTFWGLLPFYPLYIIVKVML